MENKIDWSARWSVSPNHFIWSDSGPPGSQTHWGAILVSGNPKTQYTTWPSADTQNVIAGQVWALSNAPGNSPVTFTHKEFDLSVTLHDNASNAKAEGTLTFQVFVDGTLSLHTSSLKTTVVYNGPKQPLHLGPPGIGRNYWVDLQPTLIAAPGLDNATTLMATIKVDHNPEPASLVLAVMGLPLVGVSIWRKRRARRHVATEESA